MRGTKRRDREAGRETEIDRKKAREKDGERKKGRYRNR